MYEPTAGRWLTADPIGFAGGDVNLYRYVGNNPVTQTDPSGYAPIRFSDMTDEERAKLSGFQRRLDAIGRARDDQELAKQKVLGALAEAGDKADEAAAAVNQLESALAGFDPNKITVERVKQMANSGSAYINGDFAGVTDQLGQGKYRTYLLERYDETVRVTEERVKYGFYSANRLESLTPLPTETVEIDKPTGLAYYRVVRVEDGSSNRQRSAVDFAAENRKFAKRGEKWGTVAAGAKITGEILLTAPGWNTLSAMLDPSKSNLDLAVAILEDGSTLIGAGAVAKGVKGTRIGMRLLRAAEAGKAVAGGIRLVEGGKELLDGDAGKGWLHIGDGLLRLVGAKVDLKNFQKVTKEAAEAEKLAMKELVEFEKMYGKDAVGSIGCFATGTPLLTPNGHKAIEDFVSGDAVLTRDEDDPTGPLRTGTVVRTFRRYTLLLEVNVGGKWLRLSDEHPFYTADGSWTESYKLQPGDKVLGLDGSWTRIEGLRQTSVHEIVYNLEVQGAHTFFVGGPDWGFAVWVHNTDELCRKYLALRSKSTPHTPDEMKLLDDLGQQISHEMKDLALREYKAGILELVRLPQGRGAWQQSLRTAGFSEAGESVVYIVKNSKTGELLKVGETGNVFDRFDRYIRKARAEGVDISVDILRAGTNPRGDKATRHIREQVQDSIREELSGKGHKLLWDNSNTGWAPGTGPKFR